MTVRTPRHKVVQNLAAGSQAQAKKLQCRSGHLCMTVQGQFKEFWKCQTWRLYNWMGNDGFKNNQSRGAVARFYNQHGSERWSSKAPDSGRASDPIWKIKLC